MTESIEIPASHRRVRVWFGATTIADHVAAVDQAAQYEQAMRRRFASLRVTSDPVLVAAGHAGAIAVTTRPTLLGYVRADALSCAEELAEATHSLATFASTEGFTLGTVYTERDAAESAAFHALLDEVKRSDVRAVVVPTLQHLGAAGAPVGMRQDLEFHHAHVWAVDTR